MHRKRRNRGVEAKPKEVIQGEGRLHKGRASLVTQAYYFLQDRSTVPSWTEYDQMDFLKEVIVTLMGPSQVGQDH